jgi:hypothetical protein
MRFGRLWLGLAILASALAAGQAEAQTIGSFTYGEQRDPASNQDRSSVATFGYNYEGGLAWKCEPDGLNVMLILDQAIGSEGDGEVMVEYRLGGDAQGPQAWKYSRGDLVATMPLAQVAAFTQAAQRSGSISISATGRNNQGTRNYEFTLEQLGAALQRLGCARG